MRRLQEINPLYDRYGHLSMVAFGGACCSWDSCFAATSS